MSRNTIKRSVHIQQNSLAQLIKSTNDIKKIRFLASLKIKKNNFVTFLQTLN
jgi:hypothetical protein